MSLTMPRSALRHRPIASDVPEWIMTTPQQHTPPHPHCFSSLARRLDPLILTGLSMLLTLLLLWTSTHLWAWGTTQLDTLHYGSPPTTQLDYPVGHGSQPSHFTAWNLHGQIYVLEIPASNPASAHLLVGPHLLGADLAPVQLRFIGNPHRPDLLVQVQNVVIPFHNTGTTYVPAVP